MLNSSRCQNRDWTNYFTVKISIVLFILMKVCLNEVSKIVVAFLNERFKIIVQLVFVILLIQKVTLKDLLLHNAQYA